MHPRKHTRPFRCVQQRAPDVAGEKITFHICNRNVYKYKFMSLSRKIRELTDELDDGVAGLLP